MEKIKIYMGGGGKTLLESIFTGVNRFYDVSKNNLVKLCCLLCE